MAAKKKTSAKKKKKKTVRVPTARRAASARKQRAANGTTKLPGTRRALKTRVGDVLDGKKSPKQASREAIEDHTTTSSADTTCTTTMAPKPTTSSATAGPTATTSEKPLGHGPDTIDFRVPSRWKVSGTLTDATPEMIAERDRQQQPGSILHLDDGPVPHEQRDDDAERKNDEIRELYGGRVVTDHIYVGDGTEGCLYMDADGYCHASKAAHARQHPYDGPTSTPSSRHGDGPAFEDDDL
jgi:hypothetical protein